MSKRKDFLLQSDSDIARKYRETAPTAELAAALVKLKEKEKKNERKPQKEEGK